MSMLQSILDCLLTPKSGVYWALIVLLGIATAVVFFINTLQNRVPIDAALNEPNVANAVKIPERTFGYSVADLEAFIGAATRCEVKPGETVLRRYVRPTLFWWDVWFAVFLASFGAMLMIGVAPFLPWQPYSTYLALFATVMSIVYGLSDVGEDFVLADILERGSPVDPGTAKTANYLTLLKLVSITLSITSGLAFCVLQLIVMAIKKS